MKKIIAILSLFLLIACAQTADQLDDHSMEEHEEDPYPNSGGGKVEILNAPAKLQSGVPYEFTWKVTGGEDVSHTNIHSSFTPDFANRVDSPEQVNGPGMYRGSLTLTSTTSRTAYIRAHAEVDGEEYHSETVQVTVNPAGMQTLEVKNEIGKEKEIEEDAQSGAVQEFTMKASRWFFKPENLVVEKGRPVRLTVESTDSPHGIAISAFGVRENFDKDNPAVIEFTPTEVGTFPFYCSVPCGAGHSSMRGSIVVG